MMGFVRHADLKISFRKLVNNIVLSPHYRHSHYSSYPKHFDKSFELTLAVWDRMFGMQHIPEPGESFAFGLGSESKEHRSTFGLHMLPLRKIVRLSGLGRAEVLPHVATPVRFGTAQLEITSRQKDRAA